MDNFRSIFHVCFSYSFLSYGMKSDIELKVRGDLCTIQIFGHIFHRRAKEYIRVRHRYLVIVQNVCVMNLLKSQTTTTLLRACLHRWSNPPCRGRKITRVYRQPYKPGILEVVIALVITELKMSLRRLVGKLCRKNVMYFALKFSPIARCVNRTMSSLRRNMWMD